MIPLYYEPRPTAAYSPEWIRIAKRSMASLLPRYDASRMLGEYVSKFYLPASRQGRTLRRRGLRRRASTHGAWKARVRAAWPGVSARRLDAPTTRIQFGDSMPVEVAVQAERPRARRRVRRASAVARAARRAGRCEHSHELAAAGTLEGGEQRFRIDLKPGLAGRLDYRIRIYPRHELLTHPFELGLMCWV